MNIDGIININKPEGITSHIVVAKLRRRLGIKRIGHTGTLDPMATGVLPVCVGKSTRVVEYFDGDFKRYTAGLRLGQVTDTLDSTGEILNTTEVTDEHLKRLPEVVNTFMGRVMQVPPKYSAVRVDGKRLYEYARDGQDVEIKSREIYVKDIRLVSIDEDRAEAVLDITCSKGTYIRTICDDIGRILGCGAVMTSLVRTESGNFTIDKAVDLNQLIDMTDEEIESLVIPCDDTLTGYGEITITPDRRAPFRNGMTTSPAKYRITRDSDFIKDERYDFDDRIRELATFYKVYAEDEFLGIADLVEGKELRPLKVIYAGN
ncbi:MAG: tRNA pseudouridine(55) synthase TruB [Clostridiales bacterium]|nr:tRNA pseudouridine(55) synthase TruB [Candidatus Crickella merdequi]